MIWFPVLVALLLQHFFPFAGVPRMRELHARVAQNLESSFNAGDRHSGMLAYAVLFLLAVVPLAALFYLLYYITPPLAGMLDVAVLYTGLTFWWQLGRFEAVRVPLAAGDLAAANAALIAWYGPDAPAGSAGVVSAGFVPERDQIARLAIERLIVEAQHGLFGPLFWFCVLPGPVGVLLYHATRAAQQVWSSHATPDGSAFPFGWLAREAWWVMNWVPVRASALTFAIVGNFEDALFCWRDQAAEWGDRLHGVLLASAGGALGMRLGGVIFTAERACTRPDLGMGESADAESMVSVEGLLWRGVVLWALVLLLGGIANSF